MPRMIRTAPACIALGVLLYLAGVAVADDPSWVGKVVMPKKDGVKLTRRDGTTGEVSAASPHVLCLTVVRDDGQEVEVRDNTTLAGWLAKTDAVPIDEAVNYFTARLKDDNTDVDAYNRRAAAYRHLGKFDESLADFDAAIKLKPGLSHLHFNRGLLFVSHRDYDKAVASFGEAIRLRPGTATPTPPAASATANKRTTTRRWRTSTRPCASA